MISQERIDEGYLDTLSIQMIKDFIKLGVLTDEQVVDYYNNEWWDEEECSEEISKRMMSKD